MSRSNQTEAINPADKFFEWSGSTGEVTYYDKSQEKNIVMDLPFTFLVLDRVAQITGGVDNNGEYLGYWSNAVKNLSKEIITVRSKNGEVCKGLYSDIKGTLGVKFMTGLYIAYKEDDLKIGYLKLKGSALTSWIEFTKGKNIFNGAFSISGVTPKKKGATNYFEPVFSYTDKVSEETNNKAVELDKILQVYLSDYFHTAESIPDPEWGGDDNFVPEKIADQTDDDIPF